MVALCIKNQGSSVLGRAQTGAEEAARELSHVLGAPTKVQWNAPNADGAPKQVEFLEQLRSWLMTVAVWTTLVSAAGTHAQGASIEVRADQVVGAVSRFLTGACIEDVNHEIYGGIYSQMIFGESFQEPPPSIPPQGFKTFGGSWKVMGGDVQGGAGDGPKLISERPPFRDGEVGVEILFTDRKPGNAGLILRVANPGNGADNFDGYEVSLDAAAQVLRLGRHRHNWMLIKDTPCAVPIGIWTALAVKLAGGTVEVFVNERSVVRHDDGASVLPAGTVGLRQWQRDAQYRHLWVKTGTQPQALPFEPATEDKDEISSMWRLVRRGTATGAAAVSLEHPFVGRQSQSLSFASGEGEFGLENQGLNRWGMHFVGGKHYDGLLWARTEAATDLWVALESADGAIVEAEKRLRLKAGDWQQLRFSLTPKSTVVKGRFAIKLKQPSSVGLGYAFLEPGGWGRFRGLPVRRDVVEGLINQGITVLRYGGSMVNHPEYRWKKMIGPRDRRPPYHGTWYPYSSNGWGIPDFMDLCEAAGFEYVPAFNLDETPQDMADFIEYAKGSAQTAWGRQRVSDGHPSPYRLKYLELGNEEGVDENYWQRFAPLAEAIWAKDPAIILVVGDFAYGRQISDPFHFNGAAAGITSLAANQKILELARQHNREVWFDVHVGTEGPRPDLGGTLSYIDALDRIADGAKHRVVIFEFNAGNHSLRRALANAAAINLVERDGRIPIATSANCLQPDGQNDNDWDQGLLFLNPSQVWLQPPGYVTRMISRNYLPSLVKCLVQSQDDVLDVTAKRSDDGKALVLQVVNAGDQPAATAIRFVGFVPSKPIAKVEELAGPLNAKNTAAASELVKAVTRDWRHEMADGAVRYNFPPRSFTVIQFK